MMNGGEGAPHDLIQVLAEIGGRTTASIPSFLCALSVSLGQAGPSSDTAGPCHRIVAALRWADEHPLPDDKVAQLLRQAADTFKDPGSSEIPHPDHLEPPREIRELAQRALLFALDFSLDKPRAYSSGSRGWERSSLAEFLEDASWHLEEHHMLRVLPADEASACAWFAEGLAVAKIYE